MKIFSFIQTHPASQINASSSSEKLKITWIWWQDPRPHISITWALGDISDTLKRMAEEEMIKYKAGPSSRQNCIFTSKFSGILCKIGNKMHEICKFQEE